MKRFLLSVCIVCLGLVNAMAKSQGDSTIASRLSLQPSNPVSGQSLTLTYNAKGGPLGGMEKLVAIAWLYDNYRWQVTDVALDNVGDNVWRGSINLPADCALLAIKIQPTFSTQPVAIDTGDGQFLYRVGSSAHRAMPGNFVGWGLTRKPSLNFSIPDFFPKDYKEISDKAMMFWIDLETKHFQNKWQNYFNVIKSVLENMSKDNSTGAVNNLAEKLKKVNPLSEEDMLNLAFTYDIDLNRPAQADSVSKQIIKKYPHGILARRQRLTELVNMRLDDKSFLKAAWKLRKDFPIQQAYTTKAEDSHFFLYDNFYRRLTSILFKQKAYDKLIEILPDMNFQMLADAFIHCPKQAMKFNEDPKTYRRVAKAMIDEMEAKADNAEENLSGISLSPSQVAWQNKLELNFFKAVYTELCRRAGAWQDGVDAFESISISPRTNVDDLGNEAYITCLRQLGQNAKADTVLLAAARGGKLTANLLKDVKAYYVAHYPNDANGFDNWLASLKPDADKQKLVARVKAEMVNEPYPAFGLGEMLAPGVNSNDFKKDEIVILDFWATWCAPCVAALEGMQMAVDKYKNDSRVKFYFVCTQDKPTKEEMAAFWKRKGYHDMDVVIDLGGKDSHGRDNAETYMKLFPHASGIPQKAVLMNGRVRYRASGYSGSPSGLMEELSTVIELLKAEK